MLPIWKKSHLEDVFNGLIVFLHFKSGMKIQSICKHDIDLVVNIHACIGLIFQKKLYV